MVPEDTIAAVTMAAHLERLAEAEGRTFGPKLLEEAASKWRRMMREDERYRSYGTLRFLLGEARKRFESEPSVAREITSAVLEFVDDVHAPSRVHKIALRGLAWKEWANVVEYVGDLREALGAAERAIEIYSESAALHFDQTKARLVACNIYRDMGETEKALAIARECAAIFRDYADSSYRVVASMCEGAVLISRKQFSEALAIFTELVAQAEREGDRLTVARGLQNAAECARELGDIKAARDLYPRALAHFDALGLTTEANRVRWGYALSLAAEGKTKPAAISELFVVRAMYLHLGMNLDAATAALDIARIRVEADEDVRELCVELVTTFTKAGMTQNAIEALAYLREQAKHGTITPRKIARVRTYFGELARQPKLRFARPLEREGG